MSCFQWSSPVLEEATPKSTISGPSARVDGPGSSPSGQYKHTLLLVSSLFLQLLSSHPAPSSLPQPSFQMSQATSCPLRAPESGPAITPTPLGLCSWGRGTSCHAHRASHLPSPCPPALCTLTQLWPQGPPAWPPRLGLSPPSLENPPGCSSS